jgi:hypothetical protein
MFIELCLKGGPLSTLKGNNSSKTYNFRIKVGKQFFLNCWCFNATFSSISAISWRPVLVVEEAGVKVVNSNNVYLYSKTCECDEYTHIELMLK